MTEHSARAALLLLADGRFPAGGHAHSGGAEAAVADGRVRDAATLAAFCRGRLHTTGLVAAALAAAATTGYQLVAGPVRESDRFVPGHVRGVVADRPVPGSVVADASVPGPGRRIAADRLAPGGAGLALSTGQGSDPLAPQGADPARAAGQGLDPLAPQGADPARAAGQGLDPLALDEAADARTPSLALRTVSRRLGRQLMRAARAAWPHPALDDLAAARPRGAHQPVVLGVTARAAGLAPLDAAYVAAYESVSGPATAAVRLLSLDPFHSAAVLARLSPEIDTIAAAAARAADRALTDGLDALPTASAPLLDIAAEHHAAWPTRLFAS